MVDIEKYLNKLKRKKRIKQKGNIRVMSKIVKDLSSGIYSSPANCIKELINNAFDADATKVKVRAKPALDLFSITDNGCGMSIEEFDKNFSVISKSYKREPSDKSQIFKRPLIGFIGIGFIAVSEICDKLIVITKKKGDIGRIKAEIDFKKFKATDEQSNDEFYKKSEYELVYEERPKEKSESYTKVLLTELTEDFKQILLDKDTILKKDENDPKKKLVSSELENKTFKEVIQFFGNKELKTYEQLAQYWKLVLNIAMTIPVEFFEGGPVKLPEKDKVINKIREELKSYKFEVDFDGLILRKPILFPNEKKRREFKVDYMVHSFDEIIKVNNTSLSFKGYVYSQHGGIFPKEDAGIVIRVKNVKVGEIDSSYLGYPFVSNQVFRHWSFGEIYIEEGLEEALNIDRNSFRLTHPHYREIKKFVHRFFDGKIFPYCYKGFYEAQRKRREQEGLKEQQKKLSRALKLNFKDLKKKVNIQIKDERKGKSVEVIPKESKIIIRPKTNLFRKFSKKEKTFLQEILVFFESAYEKAENKGEGIDKFKEYFYENLAKREK